jgi:hypothetical protein
MNILKYVVVGIPFAVMVFVICVLCLGPMFLAARDWWRKRRQVATPIGHGIVYGSTPIAPPVKGTALHVDIHNDYVQLPKGGHF